MNLITGFIATDDVSLNGSPTVSPITVAVVQVRALLLHFGFHDLLGVVPGRAGIGHENRLIETEHRNRDQVANKEERLDKRKSEGSEKDGEEDVEHPLLRVLGADLNHFLAVGKR